MKVGELRNGDRVSADGWDCRTAVEDPFFDPSTTTRWPWLANVPVVDGDESWPGIVKIHVDYDSFAIQTRHAQANCPLHEVDRQTVL